MRNRFLRLKKRLGDDVPIIQVSSTAGEVADLNDVYLITLQLMKAFPPSI